MSANRSLKGSPLDCSVQRAFFDTGFSRVKIVGFEGKTYARVEVKDGVAVLAVSGDGRFCLIESYRPAIYSTSWEIPRGGVEIGDDIEDAARRELLEETGLFIGTEGLIPLVVVNPDNGIIGAKINVFAALFDEGSDDLPFANEDEEVAGVRWVDELELRAAIADGHVADALTVLAYSYFKLLTSV